MDTYVYNVNISWLESLETVRVRMTMLDLRHLFAVGRNRNRLRNTNVAPAHDGIDNQE